VAVSKGLVPGQVGDFKAIRLHHLLQVVCRRNPSRHLRCSQFGSCYQPKLDGRHLECLGRPRFYVGNSQFDFHSHPRTALRKSTLLAQTVCMCLGLDRLPPRLVRQQPGRGRWRTQGITRARRWWNCNKYHKWNSLGLEQQQQPDRHADAHRNGAFGSPQPAHN